MCFILFLYRMLISAEFFLFFFLITCVAIEKNNMIGTWKHTYAILVHKLITLLVRKFIVTSGVL